MGTPFVVKYRVVSPETVYTQKMDSVSCTFTEHTQTDTYIYDTNQREKYSQLETGLGHRTGFREGT